MKKFAKFLTVCGAALSLASTTAFAGETANAKYVFLFIGDGMSAVQIYAAEGYLRALSGGDLNDEAMADTSSSLLMDSFPVRGMQTTFAANHLITDSAAAGTALACGSKTNSGVIGMDPAKRRSFTSIAELAKAQGRKVGILTSVSLDHATPASFYANVPSRNDYEDIAVQAAESDFDFFGGGGWRCPVSESYRTLCPEAGSDKVSDIFKSRGWTMIQTNEGIRALSSAPKDRVVCTVPVLEDDAAMPYSIDRPRGQVTLADITDAAIKCLMKDNDKGFFMMVESGKIDWACHANDPAGMLGDVVALDKAIAKAVAFYNEHPDETLIVITGDHETGGLTIGFSGRGYETSFERLLGEKMSFEAFTDKVEHYRAEKAFPSPYDPAANNIDSSMKLLIKMGFSIDFDTLSDYRKGLLEAAYDRSMNGQPSEDAAAVTGYDKGFNEKEDISSVDYLYYGNYDALTMELSHQLANESGLGWTSYSHTAVPIPVMAKGVEASLFEGYYDNTDVAAKLAEVMGVKTALPAVGK